MRVERSNHREQQMSDTEVIQAIRSWMRHPVTESFMERISEIRRGNDIECHKALGNGNFNDAASWNASLRTLEEVLELPNEMIEDLREDSE